MSYFSDTIDQLAPLSLDGEAKYRECQVGAAWATLAHFTSSTEPALISMPTGSGKTALMMMLSILLKAERVIIITPSVALRGQVADKFKTLRDLININAISNTCRKPEVLEHTGQLKSSEDWVGFLRYDVITATPHTTSPGYEVIEGPDEEIFGKDTLIFFDEAHHSRARTWKVLMDTFANCRIILLTATPFRNDNRRLLAKLVYHYPMSNALKSGIYAPITYHGVYPEDKKDKDLKLCQKAVEVLKKHRKKHKKAKLLIRAEGVSKSSELLKLYRKAGLLVEEINYKKTLEENKDAIKALRQGDLDGVVCVDQIGEGLDIPSLKIAVLHKPRQSFPATVQFIGRICREANEDIGEPQLIACADDVHGPLQRLYLHDNAWREFIPKLIEKAIGKINRKTAFHGVIDVETELDLSPADIKPFFSARVYQKTSLEAFTFDGVIDLREEVVPVYIDNETDKDMLVIITGIEKTIPWAKEADLSTPHFDLHIFYWEESFKSFFEYTTSDKIASMIRESLWGKSLQRIDPASIAKALHEAESSHYLMFGLSNLARSSGSVPSYKTFMGTEVEGAVRPTDSRSFTPGHALAKYYNGETRGIGSNQARVWSIQRASLHEFKKWCNQVSKCLSKKGDGRLPNVGFLPSPESISEFSERPLAAYIRWNPKYLISIRINNKDVSIDSTSIDKLKFTSNKKAMTGTITIKGDGITDELQFTYSLIAPHWTFSRAIVPTIKIDDGQEIHQYDLASFLDKHPPIIVLDNGSAVIGSCLYTSTHSLPSIPLTCLDNKRDWEQCDIHVEFEYHDKEDPKKSRIPAPGKLSVHDQVEQWIFSNAPHGTLAIKDHAAGEIADFVEIQPKQELIRFYHCKACATDKQPGASISELNMLEQVLRSIDRIGTNSLLSELHERVTGSARPNTKMIRGQAKRLSTEAATFHANQWKFEVAVVNPGIDCEKSRTWRNTNTLLTTCYEWLAAANSGFLVIGS